MFFAGYFSCPFPSVCFLNYHVPGLIWFGYVFLVAKKGGFVADQ